MIGTGEGRSRDTGAGKAGFGTVFLTLCWSTVYMIIKFLMVIQPKLLIAMFLTFQLTVIQIRRIVLRSISILLLQKLSAHDTVSN